MNNNKQEKYFKKILFSKEFRSSKMDRALFEYLYHASLDEQTLDEITIARDVFEKGTEFDPNEDTIVRVHKYSLRKKLDVYYLSEGKDDTVQFEIPKGEYRLVIKEKNKIRNEIPNKLNSYKFFKITTILLLFLLIITTSYYFYKMKAINNKYNIYPHINKNNKIWKEFLSNELPPLIVLGDHFTFQEVNEQYQRIRTIRDTQINSNSDLQAFITEFQPDNISDGTTKAYFPFHSVWGLVPLLKISFSNNLNPTIKKSSDIKPEILEDYNTIFVGSIKTFYHFELIFAQSNLKYQLNPHKIIYSPPDDSLSEEFEKEFVSTFPTNDLGIAIKLPGPANNSILMIASFSSLGVPAILEYLTDKNTEDELLEIFNNKNDEFPQYFEILFRIIGIEDTAYKTEILICNELSND